MNIRPNSRSPGPSPRLLPAPRLREDTATAMAPDELATQLAGRLFPSGLAAVEFLPEGVMNHMYLARTRRGERFVIRIYPARRRKIARYEPGLIQRLHAAGCLVPQIIGHDFPASESAPAWVAYHYIEGSTLARRASALRPRKMRGIATALVENLEIMSRLPVRGFGGLVTHDLADDADPWEFVRRSLAGGIENAERNGVVDRANAERLQRVLECSRRDVEHFNGALAWGDLAPTNILLDGEDRLAGLVDFESSFALDGALSAGYFFAMDPGHPLLSAVLDAANAAGFGFEDAKLKLCAVLRAARMAKFAHRSLPMGLPQRPIADLLPGAMQALEQLDRHYRAY